MRAVTLTSKIADLFDWLLKNHWLRLSFTNREEDKTWDMEAISPTGTIVGFSGTEDKVEHWTPRPQQVEILSDEESVVWVKGRVRAE